MNKILQNKVGDLQQKSVLSSKTVQAIIHILLWIFFLSLPFLLRPPDNPNPKIHLPPLPDGYIIFFYALDIPVFYINAYILIPKVLKIRGVLIYVASVLVVIAILLAANLILRNYMLAPMGYSVRITIFTLFPVIFVYAASTSYRFLADYIAEDQHRKELENEHLKSELSFLRSQISPHFMFNVLNSIVALARKKSDLVEPVTLKLSELMRYMLYESDDRKVTLEREIEYLNSYIELQRLRFGDSINIYFDVKKNTEGKSIEPMLLIPFVENAFKHGTGLIKNPIIEVLMTIEQDVFSFMVKNKRSQNIHETKDESSGIGLTNVKRRLSLLYPDTHSLAIDESGEWFVATLNLQFK